jgi:hypothetical protein
MLALITIKRIKIEEALAVTIKAREPVHEGNVLTFPHSM